MKSHARSTAPPDVDPDAHESHERPAGLEKKRRRRNEHNASAYDADVFELLQAIDAWRRKSHRSFPAWSEVLQILKGLGWRKSAAPSPAVAQAMPAAHSAPVDPMEPVAPKQEP